MLVFGPNIKEINKIQKELSKDLELTNLGPISFFLGMEINRNKEERTLLLSQTKYTSNILARFNKNHLNPVSTPAEAGIKLDKNSSEAIIENIKLYQQ